MAIKSIPSISGPNFGGVIYGLTFSQNYSKEPSRLKLNIINSNGRYTLPKIGFSNRTNVKLGNFNFNGFVLSYNLKESAGERTLEIDLMDNSAILDRYYVLLWKPGIFDNNGILLPKEESQKIFSFEGETVLAPILQMNDGIGKIVFREKPLSTAEIRIQRKLYGVKNNFSSAGNIIYLGREMFKSSECDIASTYYTFDNFVQAISNIPGLSNITNLKITPGYKASYEGTLREVLQSWCSDFGYDFYWDYSSERVIFYDVSLGLQPNITIDKSDSSVIEYNEFQSMEGTFIQHAASYTSYPKESLKTLNGSFGYNIVTTINPYSLEFFLRNNGSAPKIRLVSEEDSANEEDSGIYGGSRSRQEFLSSAFLGYVDQNLRNIYSMQREHWTAMGMSLWQEITETKVTIISILKRLFPEDIDRLEQIDGPNLPLMKLALVSVNEGQIDKWQKIEQDALNLTGRYYRHLGNSENFFYCSANSITEISCIVDPESQNYEGDNVEFQGLKLFQREGQMSRSSDNVSELLGLNDKESQAAIQKCLNVHIDLKNTELLQELGINAPGAGAGPNLLVIYPSSELIDLILNDFRVSIAKRSHPLEKTWVDVKNENKKQDKNNCPDLEQTKKTLNCVSAEEEARTEVLKKLRPAGANDDNPVSGLVNKNAVSAKISIFSKDEVIHAPSDAPYYAIYRYEINVQKISSSTNRSLVTFFNASSPSPSVPTDVLGIDFILDNSTDTELDSYGRKRLSPIPVPPTFSNTLPQKKYSITFAGEPVGLTLGASSGLTSMDISYSEGGFTTKVEYASRPPQRNKRDLILRQIQSQLNRSSYNSV